MNFNSESCGLFFKNSAGGTVKIGPVAVSANPPNSTPSGEAGNCEGEIWYDPSAQSLKIYHDGDWIVVASAAVGYTGEVTEGNTAFSIVNGIITNVTQV